MCVADKSEIKNRLIKLRKEMKNEGVDYYIIPTSDFHMSEYINPYFQYIPYVSGFTGDSGTLLIGVNEAYLWTDGRFFTQALEELRGCDISLMKMGLSDSISIFDFLKEKLGKNMRLGVYGRIINTNSGKKYKAICKQRGAKFVIKSDLVGRIWDDRPKLEYKKLSLYGETVYGESVSQKADKIRKDLEDRNIFGYLFTKLDEIMYLFNIRGEDIPYNPVATAYAYIDKSRLVLFVNDEISDAELQTYARDNNFAVLSYNDVLRFFKNSELKGKNIGVSFDALNYSYYRKISKQLKIIDAQSFIMNMKSVKNAFEISKIKDFFIKDSAALTEALYEIDVRINEGEKITENDVCDIIYNHRSKIDGFLCESFPTIAAYGKNAAIIHYVPSKEKSQIIENVGMLLIDSGGQYSCATTDVTRTVCVGELSEEEKDYFNDVTLGMLTLMNSKFLQGSGGRNLDILARYRLWNKGINYNHGTGHGVGCCLNVHEGPQNIGYRIHPDEKNGELKCGMLITDEPGYYSPGKFGIRTENTLLVVPSVCNEYGNFYAFESLTYVPLDIRCFNKSKLSDQDILMVNNYQKKVYESIYHLLKDKTAEWLKNRLYL